MSGKTYNNRRSIREVIDSLPLEAFLPVEDNTVRIELNEYKRHLYCMVENAYIHRLVESMEGTPENWQTLRTLLGIDRKEGDCEDQT